MRITMALFTTFIQIAHSVIDWCIQTEMECTHQRMMVIAFFAFEIECTIVALSFDCHLC